MFLTLNVPPPCTIMRSCNCHWKLLTWKPTRNLDNFYTSSEFESDMESDIGKVYTSSILSVRCWGLH